MASITVESWELSVSIGAAVTPATFTVMLAEPKVRLKFNGKVAAIFSVTLLFVIAANPGAFAETVYTAGGKVAKLYKPAELVVTD